jgi:FkbM family methyltransferase
MYDALRTDLPAVTRPTETPPTEALPFGACEAPRIYSRMLALAQHAPANAFGQQLARLVRGLYLRKAPLPVDVTVEGLRMRCWLRDNTCERKFVFTPWRFDAAERLALAEVLPADGVFVDIGANVGIYTLGAAVRMAGAGRIVAIEPHPRVLERLTFNIAATRAGRGDWPRVDVMALGVSDVPGRFELRIDGGNLGGGSIAPGGARFSRAGAVGCVTIECRPLLAILEELDIGRVDALKIDIEGAEDRALLPFLRAAPEPLLPRRLCIENSDHLWSLDLRAALAARGFREHLRTRLNTVYSS